ncbi:MAG: hypothetical protein WDW36_007178 [Sanguina aurantia]
MATALHTTDANGSPLSKSVFAASSNQLVQLCNDLRQIGAQCHMAVPTLVVCGDQSAGKSSVVQRLCGINMPRSDGTCTRCPTEVRLVTASPTASAEHTSAWSCTVKIRREFNDKDGEKLGKVEESVFSQTSEQSKVEALIKGAQQAVLHPNTPAFNFLSDSKAAPTKEGALKFSRNLVVVEIKGAPVDLTLIDLPGIIRSTDQEGDKGYVALTRSLTEHYMAKDNCIIVLVVSCKTDIENQEVYALAKEADPQLSRTLGVLTKPDTIEVGCADIWSKMVQGGLEAPFPLALGWLVVRNPTKKEMDDQVSVDVATEREQEFFAGHQPWAELRQGHKAKFGIMQLMTAMSKELVRLIKDAIPGLLETVTEQRNQTSQGLKSLPEAVPADQQKVWVNRALRTLAEQLQKKAEATHKDKLFYSTVRGLFETFAEKVVATRPVFKIADHDGAPVYAKYGNVAYTDPLDSLLTTCVANLAGEASVLDIANVQAILANEMGNELPGGVPYLAVVRVISAFQDR